MGDYLPLIPQGRITDITDGAGPFLDSSGRTPYFGLGSLNRHFPGRGVSICVIRRRKRGLPRSLSGLQSISFGMCGWLTDRNIARRAEVLYVRFVQLIHDIYAAISQPNTLLGGPRN